ncbi:hypothetical protein [Helicobacter sp. 11S02596-1]|uniref:hypothetical protein n=1 Tax=Helicobacter sp. 11S02596-1 TaxID=1476194 RepID=UPI000BA51E60|nr:hypothetical protein [Helicobacter sp. 11S02596-1]PAF42498.1 hypothetical protein BJI48_06785 [Helicobacter sp. 11S02596-1]
MVKTALISGIFLVVIFLLLPNNEDLNSLGVKIIGLYFLTGLLYLPFTIIWIFFSSNNKTPIETIDDFIYQKWLKKLFEYSKSKLHTRCKNTKKSSSKNIS